MWLLITFVNIDVKIEMFFPALFNIIIMNAKYDRIQQFSSFLQLN